MNSQSAPLAGQPGAVGLDEQALDRLRELDPDGRKGAVARVLSAFESSLARMLVQLRTQLGAGGTEGVAELAHTLKSSAASVGALELAKVCAELEQRVRGGDVSELHLDIARLIAAGEAAQVAVGAILRP